MPECDMKHVRIGFFLHSSKFFGILAKAGACAHLTHLLFAARHLQVLTKSPSNELVDPKKVSLILNSLLFYVMLQ